MNKSSCVHFIEGVKCQGVDDSELCLRCPNLATKSALDIQVGGEHYKQFKIQPAEFCAVNGVGFLEGNIIKYVMRHESKNGIQDIDKAIHYLELIKQIKYGENK